MIALLLFVVLRSQMGKDRTLIHSNNQHQQRIAEKSGYQNYTDKQTKDISRISSLPQARDNGSTYAQ